MKRIDREALERAIAIARTHSKPRCAQIDTKLKDEPWHEVARYAAYCCQVRALQLESRQPPPMWVNVGDEDDDLGPIGGRKTAAVLLERMLAVGLSRYEPDPICALQRMEAEEG